MNTKLVANHLAYLRKKQALTQEELAEELSVSRQAVSHWECGEPHQRMANGWKNS